jgi:hypothetical protein
MKVKGLVFTLLTLFFFAGTAFAGGAANMKTDVPTIPETDCDQAGWISLEVAGGFDMHEGDQIEYSTTNLVPLCKNIDMFLSIADLVAGNNFPATNISAIFVTDPVGDVINVSGGSSVGGALAADVVDAAGSGLAGPDLTADITYELGFLIRGTAGSTRINITLTRRIASLPNANLNPWDATTNPGGLYVGMLGVGTYDADDDPLTAGVAIGPATYVMTVVTADAADLLTIRLFDNNEDQFISDTQAGWWEKDTVAPYGYIDDIEPEDNTLCIDTNNGATFVNGQYVWATPNSTIGTVAGASQISFSGDYTIANISGAQGYVTSTVGKGVCETFSIGVEVDQFGNPISDYVNLDPGSYGAGAAGSATGSRWTNQVGTCETDLGFGVITTKSTPFSLGEQYGLTLSFAVSTDGGTTIVDADSDAVWWAAAAPIVYETSASALGNLQYAADPADLSNAGAGTALTETIGSVTYTYGYHYNYFNILDVANDSFMIDVSTARIDKAAFNAGDIVYLKVILEKFPCGQVEEAYICLGTAVAQCAGSGGVSYSMYFPYGVGANNTQFWTGIAVVNRGATDGTATITFYGTEGGMSTLTVDVAARDIETFSMLNVMGDLVGDLTGDENFQAEVTGDFNMDGIMFVGGRGTNVVLHGYLPRK